MSLNRKILLTLFIAITSFSFMEAKAGNDTVFFNSERSVYTSEDIKVNQVFVSPVMIAGAEELEFQPVEIIISGTGESGESYDLSSTSVAYQVEGEGIFTITIAAVYGNQLYIFTNLRNLKDGYPLASIGTIVGNEVIFSSEFKNEFALVKYNPTIFDKIMSWVISMGGRVTSADEWLEIKIIEPK
jgi:hypothetical protein